MRIKEASLKLDERAALELRGIYEQYGYKKYKMRRFEEYSLYADNKDFLDSGKVITFTDLDGRLLALKPDVTLSIIKNTKAAAQNSEKLYYIENVYREDKQSHAYKEIHQLGLELLGDVDLYGIAEVTSLAVQTLETISDRYILELSHMGFVMELLNAQKMGDGIRHKLLKHIRNKNADGIRKTCQGAGMAEEQILALCKLPSLYGDVPKVLKVAEEMIINDTMENAIKELETIFNALKNCGQGANVQIDFSIVNDIDYYNGIIFNGYIEGLARCVLSGGQYDSAMKKLGKEMGAIGFALYLNELNTLTTEKAQVDADVLLLYSPDDDLSGLMKAVLALQEQGFTVRAEKNRPKGLRFLRQCRLEGENWIEEEGIC